MTSRSNSEERLESAEEECGRRRAENTRLRAMLGIRNSTSGEYSQTNNPPDVVPENRRDGPPAPEKKIALFRGLFRGREDACAIRWDGRNHPFARCRHEERGIRSASNAFFSQGKTRRLSL